MLQDSPSAIAFTTNFGVDNVKARGTGEIFEILESSVSLVNLENETAKVRSAKGTE